MNVTASNETGKPRARDLGLDLPGRPGRFNAITDVEGVAVGLRTIVDEAGRPGRPLPVRTGVTAIIPRANADAPGPVWAGIHRLNVEPFPGAPSTLE